jgi:glycosyltransferase involved in cell wall biosynthesis
MNRPTVSIVIPAYNEERRISPTLEAYGSYFDGLRKEGKIDYEILVVINNSKDRTLDIVKNFSKKYNRIRYLDLKPGGKGFAVIEGFKDALTRPNDLIGFVDADMATSPEEYYKLIKNINSSDAIIASRYVNGAIIEPKPSIQRLVAKKAFNFLARSLLLLPYRDTQCGAKLFKRKLVSYLIKRITMSQWAFDVDLLYCAKKGGFKIKEFPTVWKDIKYATINFWKAGPGMALGVIRLRILNSPFKNFLNVYDRFLSTP